MLERIVSAIHSARIFHLVKQLDTQATAWRKFAEQASQPIVLQREKTIRQFSDVDRVAVVSPSKQHQPSVFSYGIPKQPDEVAVVYQSPHEQKAITYVVRSRSYMQLSKYATARKNIFYVHVPSWASIKTVSEHEMGRHILGTANTSTGEIRLLESLDAAQRTEVLLHETMHLLYPAHSERQIRDLVRNIMGKQYCHFH